MTNQFQAREINLQSEYNNADIICLSYPKCGRTWVRYVLGHYFHLTYGVQDTHRLNSTKIDKMQQRKNKGCPLISFTHDIHSFTSELNDHNIKRFSSRSDFLFQSIYKKKPIVFLMRDPIDASISFYHMLKNQNKIFHDSIEAWFDHEVFGLRSTLHWYQLAYDLYKSKDNKIVLHYEDLKQNNGWLKLISFTSNAINNIHLKQALDRQEFQKVKHKEMKHKNITDPHSNELFFRMGGSNYQNQLPEHLNQRLIKDKQLEDIRTCVASMV